MGTANPFEVALASRRLSSGRPARDPASKILARTKLALHKKVHQNHSESHLMGTYFLDFHAVNRRVTMNTRAKNYQKNL
jgi:hypothetical protein